MEPRRVFHIEVVTGTGSDKNSKPGAEVWSSAPELRDFTRKHRETLVRTSSQIRAESRQALT